MVWAAAGARAGSRCAARRANGTDGIPASPHRTSGVRLFVRTKRRGYNVGGESKRSRRRSLPKEAGHVGEAVGGMHRAGQLDECAILAVVAPHGAERGTVDIGAEQLRLPLVEPDGADALLDAGDADAVGALEHCGDGARVALEVLVDV